RRRLTEPVNRPSWFCESSARGTNATLLPVIDQQKAEIVRFGVQRRHALLRRSMKRTRIHDAGRADALVMADVAVAKKEIVKALLRDDSLFEPHVVAMHERDAFAVERQLAEVAIAGNAEFLCVSAQLHA